MLHKRTTDVDLYFIDNNTDALNSISEIAEYNALAIDTETTGFDPYLETLLLLQIGTPNKKCFVYDMRKISPDLLAPILDDASILKLLHNAKFDYKFIKLNFGVKLKNIYDSMIAERMLNLGLFKEASLKAVAERYLGIKMRKEVRNEFLYFNPNRDEFTEEQLLYAAKDVVILFDILNAQTKKIKKYKLEEACKLEFNLIPHIAEMELAGTLIDVEKWSSVVKETEASMEELINQILPLLADGVQQVGLFGAPVINLDSQQQLLDALHRLGLDIEDTAEGTLKLVKEHHPVVPLLLQYRKASKILSSFGNNFLEMIHPVTGRIHADFNQLVSTGRMSCKDPNLQQIPAKSKFRECFIAMPGYKIISCDMSQAELRILASYANETVFKDAIKNGLDLHSANAAFMFGVSYDEVLADKELPDTDPNKKGYRNSVKALIFGLCVDGEAQIQTNKGLKPLHAIKIGDIVNTGSFYSEVIDHAYKGYKACVKIVTDRGSLILTPDHVVKTCNKNKQFVDKSVYELNISEDRICMSDGTVISCVPIKKVVYVGNRHVFDMSVAGVPYFVANGFVVHNCYGMSSYGLARRLNIPEDKAEELITLFFKKFPNAKKFLDKAAQQPLQYGYSETISGRKRFCDRPDPHKMSEKEYKAAIGHLRRIGMNTPIQGCFAADMHVAGAGYIGSNVGAVKYLPVGVDKNLLSKGVYSGIRPMYKLTTKLGFELIGTFNHRIRAGFGRFIHWTPLGKCKGMKIAMTRKPYKGKNIPMGQILRQFNIKSAHLTKELAFMAGFVCANKLNNFEGFKINEQFYPALKLFKDNYNKVFTGIRVRNTNNGSYTVYMSQDCGNFLRYVLRHRGYFNHVLLQSPLAVRESFVAGYIAANLYKGDNFLFVETKGDGEDKFIQQMLLSVGIVSSSLDKIDGKPGCTIFGKFFGNFAKMFPFLDLEYNEEATRYAFYDRGLKVEFVGNRKAYDFIGLKRPHMYVCQGIFVHNSNADVIKKATCILGERLENYDASLILQVHDELVVEVKEDIAEEVAEVVSQSIVDGWDYYFKDVPMTATAKIKPYWTK